MERDQRKRSISADGGGSGGGERKKVRETKGKEVEIEPIEPVVVPPPTEAEVDEFFAILRRMREAVKYFDDKDKDGGKLLVADPLREADGGEVCVKKRTGADLLDLNTVPDEGE